MKLSGIIKEIKNSQPRAVFCCGVQGSGKSFIVKNYLPEDFQCSIVLENEQEKFEKLIKRKQNLVIDEAGSNPKSVLLIRKQLESKGYDTMMIMSYASPQTILERNKNRKNVLKPKHLLKEWTNSINNIDLYEKIFKDNFALVDNSSSDKKGEEQCFNFYEISEHFSNDVISEEKKQKLTYEFDKKMKEIHNKTFTAFDELTTKVEQFLQ